MCIRDSNTFVAGFIGSPPMNLIKGEVRGQRFTAPGVEIAGVNLADSQGVILGVRPEDAKVSTGATGHLKGTLYGLEPTGDQTFLSVRTEAMVVEVKADRDFRQPLDTAIAIELDLERLYFFDAVTGQRIRAN